MQKLFLKKLKGIENKEDNNRLGKTFINLFFDNFIFEFCATKSNHYLGNVSWNRNLIP